MIKSKIVLLISAFLLFSCTHSIQKDESNNTTVLLDTTGTNLKPIYKTEVENEQTKTVNSIVGMINKTYKLTKEHPIDTLKDWNTEKEHENKYGPVALDLSDLDQYYTYLTYHFLIFKNELSAKNQFDRIIIESKKNLYNPFDGSMYWQLFSKSGSAYTLYNNMIIYHLRRCSNNENIEKAREEMLNNFLFNNEPPHTRYFVRIRCGWDKAEIK